MLKDSAITRRVKKMPHYYLMKNKKILRLEATDTFASLPFHISQNLLDADHPALDQEQANWRVVIFRDEIMELEEYTGWLASPEAIDQDLEEYYDFELAN